MSTSSEVSAQEKELIVLDRADQMPQFEKGRKAFLEEVQRNLSYPKLASALGISGEVLVTFVVDVNGELTEFEVVESLEQECDIAAIKAIHSTSGKWVPGIQNGEKVNVYTTARIPFHLPKAKTVSSFATVPAEYKDGEEALLKLIRDNIVYPSSALALFLQGKVFVKFIVDHNGELSDFEILQGVSVDCNIAAIRAILQTDGDWTPAIHQGDRVNSYVTLPVSFKLESLDKLPED